MATGSYVAYISGVQSFLDFSNGIIQTMHDKTQVALPRMVRVLPEFMPSAMKNMPATTNPNNPMIW